MTLKKAVMVFAVWVLVIVAAGFFIGEQFFWDQYQVKVPVDVDIKYYESLVAANKNDDQSRGELGHLYYRRGDYQKDIDQFNKAVSLKDLNSAAHFNLALAYQEVKLVIRLKMNLDLTDR